MISTTGASPRSRAAKVSGMCPPTAPEAGPGAAPSSRGRMILTQEPEHQAQGGQLVETRHALAEIAAPFEGDVGDRGGPADDAAVGRRRR